MVYLVTEKRRKRTRSHFAFLPREVVTPRGWLLKLRLNDLRKEFYLT
jgi:hypothetical protein